MMDNIGLSQCDAIDIISEGQRFLIQVFLVGVIINFIDGKTDELLTAQLLKTLLATALAVIIYHIFIKKSVEPRLKKLKKKCEKE